MARWTQDMKHDLLTIQPIQNVYGNWLPVKYHIRKNHPGRMIPLSQKKEKTVLSINTHGGINIVTLQGGKFSQWIDHYIYFLGKSKPVKKEKHTVTRTKWYFPDDILKCTSLRNLSRNLFPRVQWNMSQHLFRYWLRGYESMKKQFTGAYY